MGSVTGRRGVWAYVEGGMGALSDALAGAARAAGTLVRTGAAVARIQTSGGRTQGVTLACGEEIAADVVVSSIDPARTLRALEDPDQLPEDFRRAFNAIDFRSPVVKLNLALGALPRFQVRDRDDPPLSGTIHLGPLELDDMERAFDDARNGGVSKRPLVELTLPSVLDPTLAPAGRHVASIFAQYAPARPMTDPEWPALRDQIRDHVLRVVEEVAPGFSASIEALEVLVPPDLENVFGLTGGNIFHGAMTPDRLLFMRPVAGWSRYRTPIAGLYLCGSGTHPGGGVMGAPGRNAAMEILRSLPRHGRLAAKVRRERDD
jgi:phytoene dehydrogenase-like protein